MTPESARIVAEDALLWLARTDDLLSVFVGATGIAPDRLRHATEEPETLAAVLDFLLMDDDWVTGFCTEAGLAFDTPMRARAALPGGEAVHWT
ncbi:DUF3572 family protein [Palleronia sediminis]|uniref:DUF3572 family protein n=1 Tax=Palleronia sediminis TaxID=2547833 RepID=A0A4R6A7E6_9RHOB|nr:DUF3572 domain-containing protein [Palleronia sediminis]TDL79681.1 DUF3572 family protein [Palleronia sediminis]